MVVATVFVSPICRASVVDVCAAKVCWAVVWVEAVPDVDVVEVPVLVPEIVRNAPDSE